jgi:hypothetical protein
MSRYHLSISKTSDGMIKWIRKFQTESQVREMKNKTAVKVKIEDITGKKLLSFLVVSEDLKDDRSLAPAIRDAIKKKMSVFDTLSRSMLDIDYFGEKRDIT